MSKPRPVYVVNSRLPVYKVTYGDGLGDVVTGLFTRIAPKILPIGKEIASKTIGVLRDKIGTEIASKAVSALGTAKDKLISLVRGKKPIKLQTTEEMPAEISHEINKLAKQKLMEISGSGLKRL